MRHIIWFALTLMMTFSFNLYAEDGSKPDVKNIGFMENPPKALKDKFPMCDAFLNVQWLNQADMLGYVHFEAIVKRKSGKIERKDVWSIVDMSHNPDFAAGDLYQYIRNGQLQHVLDMVRDGTWRKTIRFHPLSLSNESDHYPLLSDHRQTVCVAYPDGQQAWIVEGKNVKQTYTEEQIDDLLQEVKNSTGLEIPRKRIEILWLLDINFDGRKDFLFEQTFLYFMLDQPYLMHSKYENSYRKLDFASNNRSCRLPSEISYPIITDGENYYFTAIDFRTGGTNIRCNLTEMTIPPSKK